MANTTTTSVTNQVQVAYNLAADFALRSIPIFDQFTTVKTAETNSGSSLKFHRWTDIVLTAGDAVLSEEENVVPIALGSDLITVTPVEYGMATVTTAKVRSDTMLPGFSADQVNLVAYNMASVLDLVCRAVMEASTEKRSIGQSVETSITASDILTADEVREEHAGIVADNVMTLGSDYVWVIHPHVSYDLKSETGDGAWIAPTQYVNTDRVYNNEIGKFAGFKFIESSRAELDVNKGSGSVDVYTNYILGAENVAKAVSTAPALVQGTVADYLNRLVPLGWYAYQGWGIFRSEATRMIRCASSIGDN